MKLAAVSQRIDVIEQRNERRDALDQRLLEFLAAAGCLGLPTPNVYAEAGMLTEWLTRTAPDLIVLTGGDSLGVFPERDRTERILLHHARQHRLPLLGICRGMQVLADADGIATRPVDGHVRTRHELAGAIGGMANSYHSLSIAAAPPGWEVLARSEDGQIEAIRHLDLPWEGWMWHPERESTFDLRDIDRLQRLIR